MMSSRVLLAIVLASIIVSASGDVVATERHALQKTGHERTELKDSVKVAWTGAIANDDAARLTALLDEFAAMSLYPVTTSNGKSALMVAAKKGDRSLAEALIEAGADVNEATQTRGTPFMFAILGGDHDMAKWLVDQGADISTVGSNGWTALTIAAAKGNTRVLQWLIEQGADTQTRDVYRYTPFLRAVDNGHEEAAALLLSLVETDVNARDEYENTALHHAVPTANASMISLLIEHGANPDTVNREGVSPMDLAGNLASDSKQILHALDKAELH